MINFRYTCSALISIDVGKIGRRKTVIKFNLRKHKRTSYIASHNHILLHCVRESQPTRKKKKKTS